MEAAPYLVDGIEAAFRREDFHVVRNSPFAGAYTTRAYGHPSHGQHAIQIEIDRSLYMDEAEITLRPDFALFCVRMRNVISDIVKIGQSQTRLAAE